jgi:acetoin utilization deacetylase AcuC-like enzyme
MRRRNDKVLAACQTRRLPCVVFMGGGYSDPIDATIDAFEDLFLAAAQAHQQRVAPAS